MSKMSARRRRPTRQQINMCLQMHSSKFSCPRRNLPKLLSTYLSWASLSKGITCPACFEAYLLNPIIRIPSARWVETDVIVLHALRRRKVETALALLRQILLTPSAPESSIVRSDQLHGMACPTVPGSGRQEHFVSTAAVALLLNQTFRHTRLEEVRPRS